MTSIGRLFFTIFQQIFLVAVIAVINFASQMKRTALFILLIFGLVQTVPALQSFFNTSNALVFNIDEEKSSEKTDIEEKKEKKDYSGLALLNQVLAAKSCVAFHDTESIQPPPCLEKLTPPPNFC